MSVYYYRTSKPTIWELLCDREELASGWGLAIAKLGKSKTNTSKNKQTENLEETNEDPMQNPTQTVTWVKPGAVRLEQRWQERMWENITNLSCTENTSLKAVMKQLVGNTVIKEHLYHIQKGGCKVFIWLDFLVFTFNNLHYLNVSATTVGGTAGSVAGPQLQGPWFNPECGVSYAVFEWVSPGFYGVQKHAGKQIDYGKKFPLSVNMHVDEALQWTGINVNSPAMCSVLCTGSGSTTTLKRIKWLLNMN